MSLTVTTDAGLSGYSGPTQQTVAVNIGNVQNVAGSSAATCVQAISVCIAIGTGATVRVADAGGKIGAATEITFRIYESVTGPLLLGKSLTGGGITVISDDDFEVDITKTESETLTAGTYHAEAWLSLSGDLTPVGIGPATVKALPGCVAEISLCIPQGADRSYVFNDSDGDVSGATEATFTIYETSGGATLLTKTLTGGGVTIASDTSFLVDVTSTESAAISSGVKYVEIWTTIGGDLKAAGIGSFEVVDTRTHD